jgi:GNAT superfamily N-acetyltransferase
MVVCLAREPISGRDQVPSGPMDAIRLATMTDAPAIDALMKASIRDIFPSVYDERQTASSMEHVASVDRTLIEDGTYFVIEEEGEIVACGGWSRRAKLYTGSGSTDSRLLDPATEPARVRAMFVRGDRTRRGLGTRILESCERAARAEGFRTLALMATMAGLPLYEHYGFVIVERTMIPMPDGVSIAGAAMERPITSTSRLRRRRGQVAPERGSGDSSSRPPR